MSMALTEGLDPDGLDPEALSDGLNPSSGAATPTNLDGITDGPTIVAAMNGTAPTPLFMWKGNDVASPHAELISGGSTHELVEAGSVVQGTSMAGFQDSPDGSQFSAASSDTIESASSSTATPGTSDFAYMIFWQHDNGTTERELMGNIASNRGFGMRADNLAVQAVIGSVSGVDQLNKAVSLSGGDACGALAIVSPTGGTFDLYTTQGNTTGGVPNNESYTPASGNFAVGKVSATSAGFRFAIACYWEGGTMPTEAEFDALAAIIIA